MIHCRRFLIFFMTLRALYLKLALVAPMAAAFAARLATALTNPVAAFLVNSAAKALTSPTAPRICHYLFIPCRLLLTGLTMTRCTQLRTLVELHVTVGQRLSL